MKTARAIIVLMSLLGGLSSGAAPALAAGAKDPVLAPSWEDTPRIQRIVSANMCADRLVLDLAKPQHIMALSPFASDETASTRSKIARNYPSVGASAEEIMRHTPDLVVVGSFNTTGTTAMLRHLRVRVHEMALANNFDQVREVIRDLAKAMDRIEAGEDLINAFDRDLANLPKANRPIRAAILQAGGHTSGTGTMTDQILNVIGITNIAAEHGIVGFGSMPLETLVQSDPDILIVENMGDGMPSLADNLLRHPVVTQGRAKIIHLPMKLWACPDPALLDAARLILSQLP